MDAHTLRLQLMRAVELRDAALFESSLGGLWTGGLTGETARALSLALSQSWHERHEDIALALQTLRDPSSVEALFAAAHDRHAYLEYDEFFGLARKCTWALADIGTAEARQRLIDLAAESNAVVAAYAQRRLDRWDDEAGRKRGPR